MSSCVAGSFLHLAFYSKAIARQDTAGWIMNCHSNYSKGFDQCRIGFPWPNGDDSGPTHNADGWNYDCFVNPKVENYWVPRLEKALAERKT
jgi:hypothetical protein